MDIIVTEHEGMLTVVNMENFKAKELFQHQLEKVYKNRRYETADIRIKGNFSIICYDLEYIYYVLDGKVKRVSFLEKEKAIELIQIYSTARFTGVTDFETAKELSKKRHGYITSLEKAKTLLYNNVFFRLGENTYSELERRTDLHRLEAKKKLTGVRDEGYTISGTTAIIDSEIKMEFIKIPWGVKRVEVSDGNFFNQELRVIVLPDTVTELDSNLDIMVGNLRYINIPKGLNDLPKSLLRMANSLIQIENAERIDSWGECHMQGCIDLRYADFSSCKEVPNIKFHNEREDDGEEWID